MKRQNTTVYYVKDYYNFLYFSCELTKLIEYVVMFLQYYI